MCCPANPRTGDARARARARGLDLPGLVLLAATVTLLTVPPVLGQELDWPAARPLIAPRVLGIPAGGP